MLKRQAKMLKGIKKDANVCIWGINIIAQNIYQEIKEKRPDVKVKFFLDSTIQGECMGLPIFSPFDLDKHLNEIDTAIAASFSQRFYMDFIFKAFGIKNTVLMDKKMFEENKKQLLQRYNVNKTAKVFKTHKERALYRFLARCRTDQKKYESKIKKYHDKKYPNRITQYPLEHYFEFTKNDAIEVTLDCGGYDGMQALYSLQMFPNTKKVYMFEPCYDKFKNDLLDKLIKSRPEIEIVQKAIWSENTTLEFREDLELQGGSAIFQVKPNLKRKYNLIKVPTVSIDSFVEENKLQRVDFIKMDLENAEQEALLGANETIQKFRPQLAISIYHSEKHFYEIPLYLKSVLKDYEFRLGHYRSNVFDTVLYAIPKELLK